jgi:hypothetical protein
MYDYMLEEMADAVSQQLHVENAAVLRILTDYWRDKIAHVWSVDDMLEAACKAGKPILREDAIELLMQVFDEHDSSIGINWGCLETAMEDYRLDFAGLDADKYGGIHGVFKVWREGQLIAHQFGLFPNQAGGNFIPALDFAKAQAREHPEHAVLLSCESSAGEETGPWLIMQLGENEVSITESEVLNHVRMD